MIPQQQQHGNNQLQTYYNILYNNITYSLELCHYLQALTILCLCVFYYIKTLDSNAHLHPGESFVSRQYLLVDNLENVESVGRTLVDKCYSTIVTNELRNQEDDDTSFAGRKIQIYANSKTKQFGIVPAPTQGGQATSTQGYTR